jgi:PLP dependent protein
LAERYADVKDRIAAAARASGRQPERIVLVAVAKYAEPDQIRELMQLGQQDFGENRVQQLLQRASIVEEWQARARLHPTLHARGGAETSAKAADVRWHMIGHLQRNKVKKVVDICRLIHSVDSLRLAEEIQAASSRREHPVDVLVQVNCSGEESKFGCPLAAAEHIAQQIDTMISVRVRGLMTMAPEVVPGGRYTIDDAASAFARCRELFEDIRRTGVGDGQFNLLSMGMSGDFELAIREGSNMVRVGTAIFGPPRNPLPEADED